MGSSRKTRTWSRFFPQLCADLWPAVVAMGQTMKLLERGKRLPAWVRGRGGMSSGSHPYLSSPLDDLSEHNGPGELHCPSTWEPAAKGTKCLVVSREDLLEHMKRFSGTGSAKWIWVPYCKSKEGSFYPKGAAGIKGKVSFQLQQDPLLTLVLHHLQAELSSSCPAGYQPGCPSTQLCSLQPPRLTPCSLQCP